MKRLIFILGTAGITAFGFLFASQILFTQATAFTWDGGGTSDNWSDCVNWVGDACPTASDTVVFDATSAAAPHNNSTIDSGFGSSIGGITIASGYTGTVTQGTALTIGSGGFTEASATGTWAGGSSTLTINGAFSITAGAYTPTSSTWTLNGNFSMTGGTMAGTGKTLIVSSSLSTFTYTAGTGNFNVGPGDTGTAVTISSNSSAKTIKTGTTLAATISGDPNMTIEAGASLTTIGDSLYYIFTNNGSYTNGAGYFRAESTATFSGTTNNLDAATGVQVGLAFSPNGPLTIGSGATLTLNPAVTTIYIGGAYNNQGTFNVSGRTLEFDSGYGAGQITNYYGAVSTGDYSALTGASVAIGKPSGVAFTVLANQIITAATVTGATPNIQVDALGTLTTLGDVRVHRLTNNGNFTMGTAGFFHAERAATFDGATNDLTNATDFLVGLAYNPPEGLTIGSGDTLTLNPAVTALRMGGFYDNQGTFNISGRELRFDASFGASEIMHYAGATNTGDFNSITGATVVLAKTGGSFTVRNGQTIAVSETGSGFDLVVDLGGTLNTTGNINVFTLTNNGAFTMVGSGSFTSVNSTTLSGTTNDFTNATTMTVATAYNPPGPFTIGSGKTVLFGGTGISVGGNYTNNGSLVSTAPVTLTTGYSSITLTTGEAFGGNLVINKSGQTVTLAQHTTINGGLTITAGTLDVSASNYSLTVGGNWSKSGTFTPRSGTVTLNGTDQSITGNTTFYNLTKTVAAARTLTFAASSTTTISNTLTLQGAVGQRLSLRSSTPATQANINPQGTRVFASLDVKDSNNTNATLASCTDDCFDSGNNTNWFLSATVPGVTLVESAGSTDVTEGGVTDTYSAVLDRLPTADVIVTATGNADASVSGPLTFTTANWSTPQNFTVTATNDSVDETSPENAAISHAVTSADSGYNGLSVASITAHVTDNDTAGVTVGTISGHTTEALGTATFTVVLDTQPTADVSIGVTSDNTAEGTVSTASLTFTSVNWATPQTVTVTGVNDLIDDGNITYHAVLATTSSADLFYNVINPADVTIINDDNDTAGISVTESAGTTDILESGATDAYEIVLLSEPVADVTVTPSADAQVTVDVPSVIFTSLNWNTPRTITVTAVNDADVEGDHTGTITHAASSVDAVYNAIVIGSVIANITDNDSAGSSGYTPPSNVIRPPTVVVHSPVDQTTLFAGQTQSITWTTGGVGTNYVNLYLSVDGGVNFSVIERNVLGSGSYSWVVPSMNTTQAVIKVAVTDLVDEVVSDNSGIFSIKLLAEPSAEPPTVPVTGPSPVNGVQEIISPVEEGYYIRSPYYPTVYFIDTGLIRRPFLDVQTFHSYEPSFDKVRLVTDATLAVLPLGSPMTPKPYSVLVTIFSSPRVYALGPGNILRHIYSEGIAANLFGSNWADYVIDLPATFMSELFVGAPMIGDETVDRSLLLNREDLR